MGPRFYTVAEAAPLLSLTPIALQKRCARAAVRRGRDLVAELGGGVLAVKLGRTWRIRFPAEQAA